MKMMDFKKLVGVYWAKNRLSEYKNDSYRVAFWLKPEFPSDAVGILEWSSCEKPYRPRAIKRII